MFHYNKLCKVATWNISVSVAARYTPGTGMPLTQHRHLTAERAMPATCVCLDLATANCPKKSAARLMPDPTPTCTSDVASWHLAHAKSAAVIELRSITTTMESLWQCAGCADPAI